jgi:hypothetical protein
VATGPARGVGGDGLPRGDPSPPVTRSVSFAPKAMIVCWWHLRKRCYECLSLAGGAKDRRQVLSKSLLDPLWEGEVDEAIALLRKAAGWVRNPQGVGGPDRVSGETAGVHPRLRGASQRGALDCEFAGGEVQRLGCLSAVQAPRDELDIPGVMALAALEAARENRELDA